MEERIGIAMLKPMSIQQTMFRGEADKIVISAFNKIVRLSTPPYPTPYSESCSLQRNL